MSLGTTIDIVYPILDYFHGDARAATDYSALARHLVTMRRRRDEARGMRYGRSLKGVLGRNLLGLQAEGKVIVTLERQQPVVHITVSENLAYEGE